MPLYATMQSFCWQVLFHRPIPLALPQHHVQNEYNRTKHFRIAVFIRFASLMWWIGQKQRSKVSGPPWCKLPVEQEGVLFERDLHPVFRWFFSFVYHLQGGNHLGCDLVKPLTYWLVVSFFFHHTWGWWLASSSREHFWMGQLTTSSGWWDFDGFCESKKIYTIQGQIRALSTVLLGGHGWTFC